MYDAYFLCVYFESSEFMLQRDYNRAGCGRLHLHIIIPSHLHPIYYPSAQKNGAPC